jgi:hypothetical protein
MESAQQGLSRLGEQSLKTRENPDLARDPDWRAQTNAVLDLLKTAGQEIQRYEPVPPAAQALNATIVSLGADLVDVAEEYGAALDEGDAERMASAASRSRAILPKTSQATSQVREMEPG